MTTLTQIAQLTRKLIIFSLLGLILLFLFSWLINTVKKNLPARQLKTIAPPSISPIFDKIPAAEFPEQNFPFDIKFTVETISGKLPEASPTAKVYFIGKKQQGLLTNIRATQDAQKLGFTNQPQINDKKMIFKTNDKEFIIDPITRNFTYNYNYEQDSSVFNKEFKINKNEAITKAISFLNLINALPKDYDAQNPQTTFVIFNGAQFLPLTDKEEDRATGIRVDFFRQKIDGFSVITPKYTEGNIQVIISGSSDKNKQIIKAYRQYQEIIYEHFGIYPLRDINQAWEEFIKGNGYIVNPGNSTFTKRAVIREAFLAYYDDPKQQSYLIPVYVFTGDNGFIGIANAIDPQWLK